MMMKSLPGHPELAELLRKSVEAVKAMTPEQLREMHRQQAESFARAEAGFGSDADEAAYAAALRDGDQEALTRLEAESQERIRRVTEAMKRGAGRESSGMN